MRRPRPHRLLLVGALGAVALAAAPASAAMLSAHDNAPNSYDGTSPTLTVNPVQFVLGASIDAATRCTNDGAGQDNQNVPLRLTWKGKDATSGISGYEVWQQDGGSTSPYQQKVRPSSTSTSFDFRGYDYDRVCGGSGGEYGRQYFVIATDARGGGAFSNKGNTDGVNITDETSYQNKIGNWTTSTCACWNYGTTLTSTAAGASLTYRIDVTRTYLNGGGDGGSAAGQNIALVMAKGPDRGAAEISIDGGRAVAVNTHASAGQNRVIVWQQTLKPGTHTLKITNAGTARHPRIDVDSLLQTWGQVDSARAACNTPATGPDGCS